MNKLYDLPIWTVDHSKPVQIPQGAGGEHPHCQQIEIPVPYSEVCMHMRVAGKRMKAELRFNGNYASVQLYQMDGTPFSSPITTGEAGFYQNEHGQYYAYHPTIQMSEYERVLNKQIGQWVNQQCNEARKESQRMKDLIQTHNYLGDFANVLQFSLEIARQRAVIWTLEKLQVFLHTGE